MEKTQTAENACAACKTKSWHSVQRCGAMYTSKGRAIAKTKAEVCMEKTLGIMKYHKASEEKEEKKVRELTTRVKREKNSKAKENDSIYEIKKLIKRTNKNAKRYDKSEH